MGATLIDGKGIAAQITESLRGRAEALCEAGIMPKLVVFLVGEDPASRIYVRNKERAAKRAGIHAETVRLPSDISQEDLEHRVEEAALDPTVHGVLIQLPLPRQIDVDRLILKVPPEKDVDGFHPMNLGRLATDRNAIVPCTPRGCLELLRRLPITLNGAAAAVIGRSRMVGLPAAILLMRENCTVTLCHSHTKDLSAVLRNADIVVSATGQPGLVRGDMLKPGCTVIDVGIIRGENGTLRGDADAISTAQTASFLTPVPGGVGPMTIAMLMLNTIEAAERYALRTKQ